MSEIEELISELCPDGVEFRNLSEIAAIDIGEFVRQDRQGDDKSYPVFNGGRSFTGKYDDFNRDGEYILISARGNAGFVNYFNGKYWAGNSCYSINVNRDTIEAKFAYYFLKSSEQNLMKLQQKGVISAISKQQVSDFKIPIPPMKIQTEIVRILDQFTDKNTELISILQTEADLRKKQYQYYREQLLTFGSDVQLRSIGSLSRTLTPKIKIKSNDYLSEGIYPIIDQGQTFIGGYTNEENVFPEGEYIIFGDHTCVVKYVDFAFAQGADGIKILEARSEDILPKFLYHCMSNIEMESSYARHWSKMREIEIPVPPIEQQKKITAILDRFDSLCSDLTSGIPAEINARRKQYEFYRDKLLTFKQLS